MASINQPTLNHTGFRIKDPKISIPFYEKNFGMKQVKTLPFPDKTLYLLGTLSQSKKDVNWSAREGLLELIHEHGSENDASFKINNGNGQEYRGFGHICFSVDDIEASEKELLQDKVDFKKKLSDGRQKNIAFALDPDGYWIELIEHANGKSESKTDKKSYLLNHSMIRVKDPEKSLEFYRNALGFELLSKREFPDAKFTLYFLAFDHSAETKEESGGQAAREGILELTHNWGTESDDSFEGYYNGNDDIKGATKGYGHICVSVKDPEGLTKEIEEKYGDKIKWDQKFSEKINGIAFVRDPDGYSIEIFGKDLLPERSSHV